MLKLNDKENKKTIKSVLIIDLDKSGDKENTEMCERILDKKKNLWPNTILKECRGDIQEFAFPEDAQVTQLVIGAHSRFFDKDGKTPAKIKPYESGETSARHIGEYQLTEVAQFIEKALKAYPKLSEIKFYSCETALSLKTLNKNYHKEKRTIHSHGKNTTKKRNNIIEFAFGQRKLNRLKNILISGEKNSDEYNNISNIEIIIAEVSKLLNNTKYYNGQKNVFFQGLNGVGYYDPEKMKTASFDQTNLQELNEIIKGMKNDDKNKKKLSSWENKLEKFESNHVEGKKTVDKIVYQVQLLPKK